MGDKLATLLVTSRKPDDIPAFNKKMIEMFSHSHASAKWAPQSEMRRSRNAFATTLTDDNDIAAAANAGDNVSPKNG